MLFMHDALVSRSRATLSATISLASDDVSDMRSELCRSAATTYHKFTMRAFIAKSWIPLRVPRYENFFSNSLLSMVGVQHPRARIFGMDCVQSEALPPRENFPPSTSELWHHKTDFFPLKLTTSLA